MGSVSVCFVAKTEDVQNAQIASSSWCIFVVLSLNIYTGGGGGGGGECTFLFRL